MESAIQLAIKMCEYNSPGRGGSPVSGGRGGVNPARPPRSLPHPGARKRVASVARSRAISRDIRSFSKDPEVKIARKCLNCKCRKEMTRFDGKTFTIEDVGLTAEIKGLSGWRCRPTRAGVLVARFA